MRRQGKVCLKKQKHLLQCQAVAWHSEFSEVPNVVWYVTIPSYRWVLRTECQAVAWDSKLILFTVELSDD